MSRFFELNLFIREQRDNAVAINIGETYNQYLDVIQKRFEAEYPKSAGLVEFCVSLACHYIMTNYFRYPSVKHVFYSYDK